MFESAAWPMQVGEEVQLTLLTLVSGPQCTNNIRSDREGRDASDVV